MSLALGVVVIVVVLAALVLLRARAVAPELQEPESQRVNAEARPWRSDEAYMNQAMPPDSPADQARRFVAMTKARDAERRARALLGGSR